MDKNFGWCFIGAGKIAHKVFRDAATMHVVSVCTRSLDTAQTFARETGAAAYDRAEEAITAPGVDAVYICTPHNTHAYYSRMAMMLGKPVLCEKPFAMDRTEAETMVKTAHETKVFLMEAMWTRFNPVTLQVLKWIGQGAIGDLHYAEIDFGICPPFDPSNRFYNPALGGGSLLDLAVYPITYAQMLFQAMPVRITTEVTFAETGVDDKNVMILKYPGNRIATLYTGLRFKSRQQATLYGSLGWINVPVFWGARSATHFASDGTVLEEFTRQDPCMGWKYEIDAFTEDVQAGKLESEMMPLQASIDVLSIMDTIREQMGRSY